MKLTESQKEQFKKEFDEFIAEGKNCPICNNNHWEISDRIFELSEFFLPGKRTIDRKKYLVIPINCSKCGNTIFINILKYPHIFNFLNKQSRD